MKVLRLTRHPAVETQLMELRRIYGEDTVVVEMAETVPNVEHVKAIVEEYGADVLEAVLPLPLIAECVGPRGLEVPVIRAITIRKLDPVGGPATFEFSHYERIQKVEVITERL